MISAILLAAGQSKRMNGENKLVKEIEGIPLINHTLNNILNSNFNEIIIVLGHEKQRLKKIIDKNDKIKFIFNPNFKNGIASSIKIGINNLSPKSEAFAICLADMPMINLNIYNMLINAKNNNEIIVPTFKGQQANPVLFSISMKEKVSALIKNDTGAKKIIEQNKDKVFNIEVDDQSITQDFNTSDNFNL